MSQILTAVAMMLLVAVVVLAFQVLISAYIAWELREADKRVEELLLQLQEVNNTESAKDSP